MGVFALTLLILQALVLASWIAGLALMLPSWASSTALIVGCRDVPAARPRAASPRPLVLSLIHTLHFQPIKEVMLR